MDVIIFDIETIPQQSPLSSQQKIFLNKRLSRMLGKDFLDSDKYEESKRLIMGTSPYLGEIVCIGLKKVLSNGQHDSTTLTGKEKDILIKWWGIVGKHRGLFVHYNGLGFDVPFILKRSMKHDIKPTNKDFLDLRRYSKYPQFDVQMILADWDRYNTISLDQVCNFLNVPSPKEGDIKAEDVEQAYKDGRIKEISDYCLRDVESTYEVYKKLAMYIK